MTYCSVARWPVWAGFIYVSQFVEVPTTQISGFVWIKCGGEMKFRLNSLHGVHANCSFKCPISFFVCRFDNEQMLERVVPKRSNF